MKKIFVTLILTISIFALSACGSNNDADENLNTDTSIYTDGQEVSINLANFAYQNVKISFDLNEKSEFHKIEYDFDADGNPEKTEVLNPGDKLILPDFPTNKNQLFIGWLDVNTGELFNFYQSLNSDVYLVPLFFEIDYNFINIDVNNSIPINFTVDDNTIQDNAYSFYSYYDQTIDVYTSNLSSSNADPEIIAVYKVQNGKLSTADDLKIISDIDISKGDYNTKATFEAKMNTAYFVIILPYQNDKYRIGTAELHVDGISNRELGSVESPQFTPSSIPSQTITLTEGMKFPVIPVSSTAHYFAGWYDNPEGAGDPFNFADDISENVKLYAKWVENEVILNKNDGGLLNLNGIPSRNLILYANNEFNISGWDNVNFMGWYTQPNGQGIKITDKEGRGVFDWNSTLPEILYPYFKFVNVSIYENDSLFKTFSVKYGETVDLKSIIKFGYSRVGIYTNEDLIDEFVESSIIQEDIILYTQFDIIQYNINYYLNGGVIDSPNLTTYNIETSNITLKNPTREGYILSGWYNNPEFKGERIVDILSGSIGDLNLYAKWLFSYYKVSFQTNAVSEVNDIILNTATTIIKPSEPIKIGYTFSGWYTNEQLTQIFNFNTVVTEHITLYAKWTINHYTITFNSSGGPEVTSITQHYGSKITEPEKPVAVGYTFGAWFTNQNFTNVYVFNTMPAENLTLYAGWRINQYTIIFESNGGSEVTSITQDFFSEVTEPTEPTKEGYSFAGWYTNIELTDGYIFSRIKAKDIILYAKWIANTNIVTLSETNTHTVSFDKNDGSGIYMSQSITEFTSIVYPDIPNRSKYIFAGWYGNKAYTGLPFDFTMPVESDIVLYAKWVFSSNAIIDFNGEFSFNTNGSEVSKYYDFFALTSGQITIDVDYFTSSVFNAVLIVKLEGASSGYRIESSRDVITFNVVAGEKYTLLIHDSQWSQNGTTADFRIYNSKPEDGGLAVDTTHSLDYNSFFVLDIPEKEGYTFAGWYDGINGTDTQYTDMYGVSIRPWDKLSNTILYPSWIEFNGLSEININDFDSYFGFNMYSSLPGIFSNDYKIVYEKYDDLYAIFLDIFDWTENDKYIYIDLLDTLFTYDENEKAWKINNYYYAYVFSDHTTYNKLVYGILFYTYD